MSDRLEMYLKSKNDYGKVCVVLKSDFKWDEIIAKYGVKIWDGNKICGPLNTYDKNGVIISAEKIGLGKSKNKDIKIEFEDIDYIVAFTGITGLEKYIWDRN